MLTGKSWKSAVMSVNRGKSLKSAVRSVNRGKSSKSAIRSVNMQIQWGVELATNTSVHTAIPLPHLM